MHVHLSGLLQIVQSLDSFQLSTYAAIDLLKGVASIIGYLPPEQVVLRYKIRLELLWHVQASPKRHAGYISM